MMSCAPASFYNWPIGALQASDQHPSSCLSKGNALIDGDVAKVMVLPTGAAIQAGCILRPSGIHPLLSYASTGWDPE